MFSGALGPQEVGLIGHVGETGRQTPPTRGDHGGQWHEPGVWGEAPVFRRSDWPRWSPCYNAAVTALRCGRCGAPRDTEDNFCRRCGHQFTVNLPAVRQPSLPVRSQGIATSLVGSFAVLAVGTGLEWLARRFAGSAARAAGRAVVGQERLPVKGVSKPASSPAENATVDEILYVRKLQLRR